MRSARSFALILWRAGRMNLDMINRLKAWEKSSDGQNRFSLLIFHMAHNVIAQV